MVVIVVRFMLCELNGVSSSDVRLVVVISGDDGVG